MARINIEECWWSDPRRTKLLLKIGFSADAAAVNMWRVAQEFWGKSRGLVPKSVYDKIEYAGEMIECGLADVRESFVYVRGCSEYLEWHAEKREQAVAAGKKSAEMRRKKNGTAQPSNGKGYKKTERKPNEVRTVVNGTEPSLSGSLSDSDSLSGSGLDSAVVDLVPEAPASKGSSKELNRKIWEAYSLAYFNRYGTEPVRDKIVNSQVAKFGERLGEEAPSVARFYVHHNKDFYLTKSHDFGLCLSDASSLRTQWATGTMVTNQQARQIDNRAANHMLMEKLKREGK